MDLYARVESVVKPLLAEAERRLLSESPPEPRSLVAHSLRVARLSRRLAEAEGGDPLAASLAGLLHDVGKFSRGRVLGRGEDEISSARVARKILLEVGVGKKLADRVTVAIEEMYGGRYVSPEQAALHDADVLDKAGVHGLLVEAMKWALRGDDVVRFAELRISQFLTYSRNLQRILLTVEGGKIAAEISGAGERAAADLLREVGYLFSERLEVLDREVRGIPVSIVVRAECGGSGEGRVMLIAKPGRRGGTVLEVREECPDGGTPLSYAFYLPEI